MEVYALVGASGTGKSHRARMVAYGNKIDYIIDDGLLIQGNKVVAGKSAKKADTKIRAVKRAIFMDSDHAQEVKGVLRHRDISSILILGTSVRMIYRIISALDLNEPTEIIRIEDISSPEEIKTAKQQRERLGKHVIPVPTVEIEPRFTGYIMESLELLFFSHDDEVKAEKTIIRPKFSSYGKLLIADRVMTDLVSHIMKKDERVTNIKKIKVKQQEEGTRFKVKLEMIYGPNLNQVARELQAIIKELIEYSTWINVIKIDIEIMNLTI